MTNASSYQRNYWLPQVAELYGGEYCRGCGISKDSKNFVTKTSDGKIVQREVRLRLDKINNDGNHNITDNVVTDFQIMCVSCNRIKNPSKRPVDDNELQMTASERKNRHAEKPLMEWLFLKIREGHEISWKWFVAEGSYRFDVSPKTINERYFVKYFEAESAPFEIYHDIDKGLDMIKFKDSFERQLQVKPNLDIVGDTPTLSFLTSQDKE